MVQVRYVVWMSVWIFSVSSAQDVDIAQLLVNTEGVRLSDPQLFNKNIDILESKVEKMTNEQSCLFDYLSAYQMAYKGQYESLDGLLNQKLGQCEFPAIQARMYALRANTLVISGKFEAGLENLDLAIEKAQLAKNEKVLTYVYSAAGIVYDSINQTSLSIKYAELTQEIHPSGQNLCKLNYFVYKAKVEDINTPINQLGIESAIKQCKENKQAISYLFLSFYYLKHQVEATYSNDFSLSQVSEKLAQLELDVSRTNYPNIQSFYWAMVAFVDEKLGHIEQAEGAANLSLKINEDFGDTEQKVMSLEVLLQVALQKANDEAAYTLLKERTDSEQRRFNEKQAKLAAFMKVKHDNLAKTHEISMLSQKNKLLENLERKLSSYEDREDTEGYQNTLNSLQESTILTDSDWDDFRKTFDTVHVGFLSRIKEKYPNLSPAELRYITLAKLEMSTKEMASILGIGVSSVRTAKSRLLKKLDLNSDDELVKIINTI